MATNTPFPGDLSPFPAGYVGLELFIGGAWVPVPMTEVGDDGVTITRGRQDEAGQVDPTRMTCRLKNPTGKWSPRNPSSPYYGLIGRNTPVRVWVDRGLPWVALAGAGTATTPDTAALSITGDLDVRWFGRLDGWGAATGNGLTDLISKYGTTGQRSWALQVNTTGTVSLFWSANGTALLGATSTVPLRASTRRVALRVTLDVDNGAAGNTVTFWTADSLTGTWTQLGDPVVQPGITSIFDSTAPVTVGKNANTTAATPEQRVYGWQVLQGIAGTVRASVDTSTLTVAAGTFSDGTNTWTLTPGTGTAAITRRHYRFWGEVVEWPQKWTKKGSPSAYAAIEAAGVLRRLGQGASPLRSALYRTLAQIGTNLVAYWPAEDKAGAKVLAPAVGGRTMAITGTPKVAEYSGFAASAPIPTVEAARVTGNVPGYTGTGSAQVRWVTRIPASTPNGAVLIRIRASGTLGWAEVRYGTGGALTIEGFNDAGVSVGSNVYAFGVDGKNLRVSLELTQSGGNITWNFATYEVGAAVGGGGGGTFTGVTLGAVSQVDVNPLQAALAGVAVGHVTVEKAITTLFDVSVQVLAGYLGEKAAARIARLGSENALPVAVTGASGGSAALNVQTRQDILTLLREAAASDGGILYEPRTSDDLAYRTLESQYSQVPVLTIPYTDNLLLPFEPIDDDQATRNKVTVERDGGSSFTVEDTTSALSTQPPPAGVGVYDEQVTLSLATDSQCEQQAGWRVRIGTHDEARWPAIGVDLAHPTFRANDAITRQLLELDLGDRVDVTGLPAWLPPDSVSQLVQGYTEHIGTHDHRLDLVCTPARPYRAAYFNTPGGQVDRWSGDGTVLTSSAAAGVTALTITPPPGVLWTTADGPYDVLIAGERLTFSVVTGTGPTQAVTAVRAVNGVAKLLPAGAAVVLYDPCFYGL